MEIISVSYIDAFLWPDRLIADHMPAHYLATDSESDYSSGALTREQDPGGMFRSFCSQPKRSPRGESSLCRQTMYTIHYLHRAVVSPLLLSPQRSPQHITVTIASILFNLL